MQTPGSRPLRTWTAAVTLFFLASLIPETVATYNSPPLLLLAFFAVFAILPGLAGPSYVPQTS
jgi:hypothetical protein